MMIIMMMMMMGTLVMVAAMGRKNADAEGGEREGAADSRSVLQS